MRSKDYPIWMLKAWLGEIHNHYYIHLVPREYKDNDSKYKDITRYNSNGIPWFFTDKVFKYNQEDICFVKSALDLDPQETTILCERCSERFRISKSNIRPMYLFDLAMQSWKLYRVTCPFCGHKGFYFPTDLLLKSNALLKEIDSYKQDKE